MPRVFWCRQPHAAALPHRALILLQLWQLFAFCLEFLHMSKPKAHHEFAGEFDGFEGSGFGRKAARLVSIALLGERM